MSRAFDGVDDRWLVVVSRGRCWCRGARERLPVIPQNLPVGGRGGQGRLVRAARRGSLDGPGGSVVASHPRMGPPIGRSWLLRWWLGTADLTIAQHLERGDRDARRPAIPSRRVRMVCSGHSQNGLTQIDGHATKWGPRRYSSSRPGCVRACSSGLPIQAADLAVAQPVVDQLEQFSGRRHLGDLDAGLSAAPLGDATEGRFDRGAAVVAGD